MRNSSQTIIWTGLASLFVVLALIVVYAISSIAPLSEKDDAALIDQQRPVIEDIVREYLLQNPEIVRDSLIELERRDQVALAQQQENAIAENSDLIFNSRADFVTGNPNGDVTLVEFFDYNCGFCRRALADLHKLLEEDTNLRVVLKEFPVLSQGSNESARISMSAIDEADYLQFHDALFAVRGGVNGEKALEVARNMGLDVEKLGEDAKLPEKTATLAATLEVATALGINGTPSYIIGNQLVVGAVGYDQLKEIIDAERAKLQASN